MAGARAKVGQHEAQSTGTSMYDPSFAWGVHFNTHKPRLEREGFGGVSLKWRFKMNV